MLPHIYFLISESEIFCVIVKRCIFFVYLLNVLVVIGVIWLLRSDSDQYSHQSKGRMIASYFKLSNKSPAYGRHWISRPVWLVALTQKSQNKKICRNRRETKIIRQVSHVRCQVSYVRCQLSGVRSQVSHVPCYVSPVTQPKNIYGHSNPLQCIKLSVTEK